MTNEPTSYQRLPGRAKRYFEYFRLYLAADHLLLVTSMWFTESYRRFYLRDIQCFSLRRTPWRLVWNILLAGPLVISVVMLAATGTTIPQRALDSNEITGLIVVGALASLFLLCLVVNTVRGPTCVCNIHTAVQTRRLFTLGRINRARKVISQLKPLIEAAQGPPTSEELARQIDAAWRGKPADANAPPVVASSQPEPPVV